MMRLLFALLLAIGTASAAAAPRSKKVLSDFAKLQKCPSTGLSKYPCPGYQADHVIPICAGGPDRVENLQWTEAKEAAARDRWEKQMCAKLRKFGMRSCTAEMVK